MSITIPNKYKSSHSLLGVGPNALLNPIILKWFHQGPLLLLPASVSLAWSRAPSRIPLTLSLCLSVVTHHSVNGTPDQREFN